MKNKLLILLSLGVVLILAVLSVQEYDEYQSHQKAQAQSRVSEAQRVYREASVQINELQSEVHSLQAECQHGLSAYTQLPASKQNSLKKPDCSSVQLQ